MLKREEVAKFLEQLYIKVWQNSDVACLPEFYDEAAYQGHFGDGVIGYADLKARILQQQQHETKIKIEPAPFIIIDDLVFLRIHAAWVTPKIQKLSQHASSSVFRFKAGKIVEEWKLFDVDMPASFQEITENLEYFSSQAQCDFINKAQFTQQLQQSMHFHPELNIRLTDREIEYLYYFLNGYSAKEAARKMGVSFRSVQTCVDRIKQKFHCSSKSELRKKLFPDAPSDS